MDQDNLDSIRKIKDYDTIKALCYSSENQKYTYSTRMVGNENWKTKKEGKINILSLISDKDEYDTDRIKSIVIDWIQGKNKNLRIDRLSSEEIELFDLDDYQKYLVKYDIS